MPLSSPPPRKTALITGANRGIGRETARQLAERGFAVVIGARNRKAGETAAREIAEETGGQLDVLELDVSDAESIHRAYEAFGEIHAAPLDVLINNAGIYEDGGRTILEVDPELFHRSLTTNTLGPLLMVQHFFSWMDSGGRIINLSSGLGQLFDMGSDAPSYSISKTALNAVTRQLAAVLGERGIAVNAVCPGWVRTDMGGANATRTVEEGADTVVWLATEAPQELTGQLLRDRAPVPW